MRLAASVLMIRSAPTVSGSSTSRTVAQNYTAAHAAPQRPSTDQGDPMIKLVFTLRRSDRLSREEFQRYWREEHAPLVKL